MMDIKNIVINGRYSEKNGHYFFYNGGSGFSFRMKGKSFTIGFNSKPVEGYYYIIIDRDYKSKIKVYTNKPYRCLIDPNKEHDVDIVKANEANDNVFELTKFEVDGELLKYIHVYDKNVKIYGDSTIAGFGILEKNGGASVRTNDAVRDFCYRALYEMNFNMNIMSASGYGLTFSAYTCPKSIGVYDFIEKVAVNSNVPWIDKNKYDILIVSLGCNDNSYIQEQPSLREENTKKFIEKYKNLIDSEIKTNSELKILMVYGTLKEEIAYHLYEKTYEHLKPLYKNLYIHKFNGDNSAISNHAYVAAHDQMAEELKAVIKDILKR